MEIWELIDEDKEIQFLVSTAGRIKNRNKATLEEIMMKPTVNTDGRKSIILPTGKRNYVYRWVAELFIPNPESKPTVNHKCGLKGGDGIDNLEWMTYKEQRDHSLETGLATPGYTPTVVLNSNGDVISRHDTKNEALKLYKGRQVYYNADTQIIGSVIVMKESYYNNLIDDELLILSTKCFERMMEFAYVMDGQLFDGAKQVAAYIDDSSATHNAINNRSKNKWSFDIGGQNVSRLSNMLGMTLDKYNMESYDFTQT